MDQSTSTQFETFTTEVKFDPQQAKAAQDAALAAQGSIITVVNDTNTTVAVTCGNGFLGVTSVGYALPGQSVEMTCSPAWWDIYALFETSRSLIISGWGPTGYNVTYNRKKTGVGIGATVRVSEMQ